jgi:hypothetical protein
MGCGIFEMAISGKLTKNLVENLGAGRHGDGNGLYLVVDPSGARRWIVRVVVKGAKNKKGAPLRTDFGLGGADIVTINQARERALEYRRMAKQGLNPRFNAHREVPTFEEFAQQVHIERMPTWKNAKHGQQWINTLRDYAFPKIGRMPLDSIDQPEVMMCLSPIWTEKHETARRLAQRIKTVLDVARSKGFRSGENPVTAIKDAGALPSVTTGGTQAHGLYSFIDVVGDIDNNLNDATATALLNDGDVKTTGNGASGLVAETDGLGATLAQMNGGSVTTEGIQAHGLYSSSFNGLSTATVTATLTSGDVKTIFIRAHGVYAVTAGTGLATATVSGTSTVMASGNRSNGITVRSNGSYAAAVTDTAVVTGGAGVMVLVSKRIL